MLRQPGFSLIELVVVLAIAAILFATGMPAFQTMISSNRTKGVADSILAGLRTARSTAISRNSAVRFQLVSSLAAGCVLNRNSLYWLVTESDQVAHGNPAGACNLDPFTPPDQADPCNPLPANYPAGNPDCTVDPFIVKKSIGSPYLGTSVAADSAVITFGPLGQLLTNYDGSAKMTTVNISSTNPDAKSWRITVKSSGAIKLCDPSATITSPVYCS